MKNSSLKKALNYISKLISTALLIVLIIVGLFLVYYLISAKMVAKNPAYEPKLNLYTIVSGSMEPNIRVYDVILDYKVNNPADLKIGDVITFRSTSSISQDLIVTHRIIDTKIVNGNVEYVTKGDFNSSADSDTAKFDRIIGKVILKFPQLGRIQFFLATKMGWFLVVLLPAMCVIIYDIIKLFKLLALKKSEGLVKNSNNSNVEVNIHKVDLNNKIKENEIINDEQKEVPVEEKELIKEINNDDVNYQNNSKDKDNNIPNIISKKNKKKNNKEEKIINDTLKDVKNSDYLTRLNSLRDYENKK